MFAIPTRVLPAIHNRTTQEAADGGEVVVVAVESIEMEEEEAVQSWVHSLPARAGKFCKNLYRRQSPYLAPKN